MHLKRHQRFNGFLTDGLFRRLLIGIISLGLAGALVYIMVRKQTVDPLSVGVLTVVGTFLAYLFRPRAKTGGA